MAGDHLLTKKYWRRELNASYFDGCMHDARVRSPGARPACTLETEGGIRYGSPTDNSPGEVPLYIEWGKLLHTEYGEHAISLRSTRYRVESR